MSDFFRALIFQGDEVDYEAISDEETSTWISNTTATLTTILATGTTTSTISPHLQLQERRLREKLGKRLTWLLKRVKPRGELEMHPNHRTKQKRLDLAISRTASSSKDLGSTEI